MSERHEILNDENFWLRLEFEGSGWFATCDDHRLRQFWIDGFRPELARNTKFGIEVEGTAWVADGAQNQSEYRFIAVLPQKLLHRRNPTFVIDRLSLDEAHQTLLVELSKSKSIVGPGPAPNGGPPEPSGNSKVIDGPPSVR